ncbi:undecaprenyl phosphate translocase family protein [Mycoplasma marinum]|nr:DUF368 domain-containing protein [Mycoplasma marinum]
MEKQNKKIDEQKNEESVPKRMAYGVLMGLSDGTPGFSGGTTLSLLNFYDKLIMNFKGIFKPQEGKTRVKHLMYVLPFMIMWVGTLLAFMVVMNQVSKHGYGVVAVFAFATFALLSIPLFILVNKPKIYEEKTSPKEKNKFSVKYVSLVLLGFAIMIAIGLIVRFAFDSTNGGVTMVTSKASSLKISAKTAILLLTAGFCAGFAMLIPGISGSLVLYLFNVYSDITHTISNAMHGEIKEALPVFAILGIAILCGIITSIFTTSFILQRWKDGFVAFSLGLVSASFITILIALSKADYETINSGTMIALTILGMVIAIGLNLLLAYYLMTQKVIEIKK